MKRVPVLALIAIALAGCFHMDVGRSPALGPGVEEHVVVSNYGWALFGCIPLVCGNARDDSWCPFTFFRDEVAPSFAYAKLLARAEAKGCDLADIGFLRDNDVLFDAYYTAVPWIIVYKESNISANLVRKDGGK